VAIFGNGFNSTAGIAKLFVLMVSKGNDGVWCHPDAKYDTDFSGGSGLRPGCAAGEQDFVKLDTGFGARSADARVIAPRVDPMAGKPNGLGTPRVIDIDGNGTADVAYAGDNLGNMWRFDMTATIDMSSPDFSLWTANRIFEATYTYSDSSEMTQPIHNRPLIIEHPTQNEGYIVIFASGSYLTSADRTDTAIQSIYGIWDRLGVPFQVSKTELALQEYTNLFDATFGNVRTLSSNTVDYDLSTTPKKMGWYNDLDAPAVGGDPATDPPEFPGERAVRNLQLRGGLSFVNSIIPRSKTSCTVAAGGFALAFCPGSGGLNCLLNGSIFDLNNDGVFDSADEVLSQVVGATRFEDSVPTDSTFFGGNRVTQLSDQTLELRGTNTMGGVNTGRLSWRRLQEMPE
jgi:type IV pilus assembly protein PilY1